MAQAKLHVSLSDFEVLAKQAHAQDKNIELHNGEIIEVPSNPYASAIAARIIFFLQLYLMQNGLAGHVTGADGGYIINGDVYAPDVAYLSHERQATLPQQGFNPMPPQLAVEVISDPKNAQEQAALRRKVVNYLAAHVVVWVVNPDEHSVDVYAHGQPARQLTESDTLSGALFLDGFSLAVRDIFPPTADR